LGQAARARAILTALRWTLPAEVSVSDKAAQGPTVLIRIVAPDLTHWILDDKSSGLKRAALSPQAVGLMLRRYHLAAALFSAARLYAEMPRLTSVRVDGALQLTPGGTEHLISRAILPRDQIVNAVNALEELQHGAPADSAWYRCRFDREGRKIDNRKWEHVLRNVALSPDAPPA
jgi:hypothetical protein